MGNPLRPVVRKYDKISLKGSAPHRTQTRSIHPFVTKTMTINQGEPRAVGQSGTLAGPASDCKLVVRL